MSNTVLNALILIDLQVEHQVVVKAEQCVHHQRKFDNSTKFLSMVIVDTIFIDRSQKCFYRFITLGFW